MGTKASCNLIVRPEKLGDLVVATPAIRAMKESYPDQELHVLTDELFAPVLDQNPFVDKIITVRWKGRKRFQHEPISLILSKLRKHHYSRAAILYPKSDFWNWVLALSGVSKVSQCGGTWSALALKHKIVRRSGADGSYLHYRDTYLKVVESLGASITDRAPQIYLHPGERKSVPQCIANLAEVRPRIILHIGGSPEGDNYGIPALAKLSQELAYALNAQILITGTNHDKQLWRNPNPLHVRDSALGNLNIRELISVISQADLVIANSTGVIHLAAALDKPILGLYGSCPQNDAKIWGPISLRSRVLAPSREAYFQYQKEYPGRSMPLEDHILPEDIIQAAHELLSHF